MIRKIRSFLPQKSRRREFFPKKTPVRQEKSEKKVFNIFLIAIYVVYYWDCSY